MSLPYDDIVVAKRMKVDRSNYSKAVNAGPITNAFLRKFYLAFGEELKGVMGRPVEEEEEELLKRIATMEQLLVKLVETNNLIARQMEQLAGNAALLVKASEAGIEALSRIGRRDRGSNNS